MSQPTIERAPRSSRDPEFFRRLYAHSWKPGCERMHWVMHLLAERGIRYEVEGFMADSDQWAHTRPTQRHLPDLRVLAS